MAYFFFVLMNEKLSLFAKVFFKMNTSLYILIFVGILFASCVPTKDLIYLQDKSNGQSVQAINPVALKPYRLQTNDIINVTIKAIDPKLVEAFNPSAIGQQANQNDQSLYFNGFTVDDHGNIRIPVLGELNVLGFTTEEVRVKVEQRLLTEYFNKEANIYVSVKLAGF